MSIYRDLHIKNGDVVLDAGNNPTYLTDRDVIAQDIVHAILDTGLANLLVSDRGTGVTQDTQTKIKLLVEDDVRIMPGTVKVEQNEINKGQWWVFAQTIEFGEISSLITGVE
ncbi:MAG: DUF2590 family protein [Pseudoalteromonas distincta]|uniref:DUF2590 family protein n=1 Tax=Pseudoalteromonas TaxID=53246 RepID=UPI000731FDA1|nr:DUF2590 family protein [Pseudoalteromonas sp. H105]KTF14836.1 hypothetical protein ATS75_12065 [Pseudoalteromonas sp. H105]